MATAKIDADLCIGCGLCVEICPKVFELRENKAWLINPKLLGISEKLAVVIDPAACDTCDCKLAYDTCPVAAIELS